MSSDLDVCNLALGFLGDSANVSSISPPEPSYQAELCAKFYPMARDNFLNMHNWGFATKRVMPASIAVPTPAAGMWQYAYITPSDCLTVTRVYDPTQPNDFTTTIPQANDTGWWPGSTTKDGGNTQLGAVVPVDFSVETDANGNDIIYTNQAGAAIAYTARVTDMTKAGPSFTIALAWLLASYLAGPLLKGDTGMKAAQAMYKAFLTAKPAATESDANERRVTQNATTPWMANR